MTAADPRDGLSAPDYFWLSSVLTKFGDTLSASAMAIIAERLAHARPEAVDELRELSMLATQGELFARVVERGGRTVDAFLTVPSIEQGRSIAGPVPMEWLADDSYKEGGPEQKAHDARFTAAAVNYVRATLTPERAP